MKHKWRLALLFFKRKMHKRNFPILLKLTICFGVIFTFMAILSYVGFNTYKKDKENSILKIVKQSNLETSSKIDDYIADLNFTTTFPLTVQDDQGDNFIYYMENFNSTNDYTLQFKSLIKRTLSQIISYKKRIQSIFVYNTKGSGDFISANGIVDSHYNPKNNKWFSDIISKKGSLGIIDTFSSPNITDSRNNPLYVFSVARAIMIVSPQKAVGVVVVNTKMEFLLDMLKKSVITPTQRIIITGSDQNIICDTITSNITKKLESGISTVTKPSSGTLKDTKINQVSYMINWYTSEKTGWKIINLIPLNELNESIDNTRKTTTIFTLIIIVISSLMAIIISRQIVNPLKKLVTMFKLVENGDFNIYLKTKNHDETRILTKSFNTMTSKLKKLINEVYLEKMREKELELQMLQNQINPHFLYNTLESISMNAEINDDESTSEMTITLGKILRYSISRSDANVTVAEELSNLKDYIKLQNPRSGGIYDIEVNVDESIYHCIIIKIILQPIVENAIFHGMDSIRSGGLIIVRGYRDQDHLIFEIKDNGSGMTDEQVRKINDYINGFNDSFKSIGLINVNKRIKLHYGDVYGITISSNQSFGTFIRITVPYIE